MKIDVKVVMLGALVAMLAVRKKPKPEPEPEPDLDIDPGVQGIPTGFDPGPDAPACTICDTGEYDEFIDAVVWEAIDQLEAAQVQGLLLTNAERDGEVADFFEARLAAHPLLGRRMSYPEWLAAASYWHVVGVPEHVWECCILTGTWEESRRELVETIQTFTDDDYWDLLVARAVEVGDPEPTLESLYGPEESEGHDEQNA